MRGAAAATGLQASTVYVASVTMTFVVGYGPQLPPLRGPLLVALAQTIVDTSRDIAEIAATTVQVPRILVLRPHGKAWSRYDGE